MSNYLPANDLALQAWLNNFKTVADANAAALGLSTAELGLLDADVPAFVTSLSTLETRKRALESAVIAKDTQRIATVAVVRGLVKRIQANAAVPDTLKRSLGISVPSSVRTKTAPTTPADVMVQPYASGLNLLRWNKNGNKPTTQYMVECKPAVGGAWQFVGQTTATKFPHTGQTPGQAQMYRAIAQRSGMTSAPSEAVMVYGG